MEGITVTIPRWLVDEIDSRTEKSGKRSKYIRQAVQARVEAEDADEWKTPAVEKTRIATDGGQ